MYMISREEDISTYKTKKFWAIFIKFKGKRVHSKVHYPVREVSDLNLIIISSPGREITRIPQKGYIMQRLHKI